MGADFLERSKASFKRSWDRERVALGTSDLLTRQPDCVGRSVMAEVVENATLSVGERVVIERDVDGLVARRGLKEVARMKSPPPDVVRGIEESCGVGQGTVEHIHDGTGIVEVSIC